MSKTSIEAKQEGKLPSLFERPNPFAVSGKKFSSADIKSSKPSSKRVFVKSKRLKRPSNEREVRLQPDKSYERVVQTRLQKKIQRLKNESLESEPEVDPFFEDDKDSAFSFGIKPSIIESEIQTNTSSNFEKGIHLSQSKAKFSVVRFREQDSMKAGKRAKTKPYKMFAETDIFRNSEFL
jgi:hypothetical protein